MQAFIAALLVSITLVLKNLANNAVSFKSKKRVLTKKQNNFLYNSLKARIYHLQVLGEDPSSSDYRDI